MRTTRTKVLAVDDDPFLIEVIEGLLENDYDLATATDGDKALDLAVQFSPDLILLDIMMPGIDGYETCRRIRAHPQLSHCKIILVSGKAMTSERLQGYAAGADDFLTKPFEKEELRCKVAVFSKLRSVEEVDWLKTQWMQQLEHELRTPLTGILLAGEALMAEEPMDQLERQTWGGIVSLGARRLLQMANQCMLLCQLKSGKAILKHREIDLGEAVDHCLQEIREQQEQLQVTFHIEIQKRTVATGDPRYLELAIQTMIDRAIRHTDVGGEIFIGVSGAEIPMLTVRNGEPEDANRRRLALHARVEQDDVSPNSFLTLPLAKDLLLALGGNLEAWRYGDKVIEFAAQLPGLRAAMRSR